MIATPAFRADLHVAVVPGEGLLLVGEGTSHAFHGEAYVAVGALIDGRRSADEIAQAAASAVPYARSYYALSVLEARGVLTASTKIEAGEAAFWQACRLDADAATQSVAVARINVTAVGAADAAPLRQALEAAGLALTDDADAALSLVVADDYLDPDLEAINAAALASGRPWILHRSRGREAWIGPLFAPGETGCWACLRGPLQRNRMVHRFARSAIDGDGPLAARERLPAASAAVAGMTAAFAAVFLGGGERALKGKVLSFDWSTLEPQTHVLRRDPWCPACGDGGVPEPAPVVLRPTRAAFKADGGHRSVPPEVTLAAYEPLVSPITGVVRALEKRGGDGGPEVYVAGHNSARRFETLADMKKSLRSAAAGKGVSRLQAKASALCEAVERFSGELQGGEIRTRRAWRDWPAGEAVMPNDVMGFSERQFDERERWNAQHPGFNSVCERLPEDLPVDWSPVWSLTKRAHRWFPTQFLYYSAPAFEGDDRWRAVACSNGAASGNTLEEAVLQGFYELVERDAVALWWYNRLKKPAVALEAFGEAYLLDTVDRYRRLERDVWALDLTSDLGIPVFAAVSRRIGSPREEILFGLGAHLDARIALQRAFAEMGQMLGLANLSGRDGAKLEDAATLAWLNTATLQNQPYVAPDLARPLRRPKDFPVRHSGDMLADIELCRGVVEGLGMEMMVLDQTRPTTGMPVAKVIVPGLRHFWARFAPGRLYDVPVKMGWLSEPLAEAQLNPIPFFL